MTKKRGIIVIVLLLLVCGCCGVLRIVSPPDEKPAPVKSQSVEEQTTPEGWTTPTLLPPPATFTPSPTDEPTAAPLPPTDTPPPEPTATETSLPLTETTVPPTATPEPTFTPEPPIAIPPTSTPMPPTAIPQPVSRLDLVSLTSPISPNSNAEAIIRTEPGAECYIYVVYKSGPSQADGLENKIAGDDGLCRWQWKVGGRTTPDNYDITFSVHKEGMRDSQIVVDFIVQ